MMNNGTTTEVATVQVGEDRILTLEAIEKAIEARCNEILEVAGGDILNHPLRGGFLELQSLSGKIIGMKNIQHEQNIIAKA